MPILMYLRIEQTLSSWYRVMVGCGKGNKDKYRDQEPNLMRSIRKSL